MKNCITTLCLLLTFILSTKMCNADIVNLTIREKAGVTTSSYPLTFGHVFPVGVVTQGIAVKIGETILPTQFDIKRRYPDNSVKHGVISVILPEVTANQDLEITLVTAVENSSNGSMTKAQILATGVESFIQLTGLTDSGYSGDLTGDLNESVDTATTLDYWLSCPVATFTSGSLLLLYMPPILSGAEE